MRKFLKILGKTALFLSKVTAILTAVLSVVYFWNLDQKVLSWLYKVVNNIFERKKGDISF